MDIWSTTLTRSVHDKVTGSWFLALDQVAAIENSNLLAKFSNSLNMIA